MADNISDATPSVGGSAPSVSEAPASSPAPGAAPESTPTSTPTDVAAPPSSATDNQGKETKEDLLSAVLKVVKIDPDADKVVLPGDGAPPNSEGQQSGKT